jgi:hypothetical protein
MQYAYARVSTIDQNPDMQLKALQRAGCQKVFTDKAMSGAMTNALVFVLVPKLFTHERRSSHLARRD